MTLSIRPTPYIVPSYSLTGDLLAYLTCGLQYRYQNRGALPPSKPVQLWFGNFIHGVMEEAYRTWKSGSHSSPRSWSDAEIVPIVDLIIRRLAARGIHFQRYLLLGIAVERAFVAINTWGPYLFPLIQEAEVRLRGIRPMPQGTKTIRQSNYYEVEGVVDVITSVTLSKEGSSNPIVTTVCQSIGSEAMASQSMASQAYEVIVDYKGMRRPSTQDQTWRHHEWQVLTYAWLRMQQPGAKQVRSGILLYLNELVPGTEDMDRLYEEVSGKSGTKTDLSPTGPDLQNLQAWPRTKKQWQQQLDSWTDQVRDWWKTQVRNWRKKRPAQTPPSFPRMPVMPQALSADYRLQRSFRVVPVVSSKIQQSLQQFDQVVSDIEASVAHESAGQQLTMAWHQNPRDETCTVCDFRTFCPAPGNKYRGAPTAP